MRLSQLTKMLTDLHQILRNIESVNDLNRDAAMQFIALFNKLKTQLIGNVEIDSDEDKKYLAMEDQDVVPITRA